MIRKRDIVKWFYPKSNYIVIVDDNKEFLDAYVWALRGISDHKKKFYLKSAKAFNFIKRHKEEVKLVITDFKMPSLNGGDLVNLIKTLNKDTKVIVSTAYGREWINNKYPFDGLWDKGKGIPKEFVGYICGKLRDRYCDIFAAIS